MKFQSLGESGFVNMTERIKISRQMEHLISSRISESSLLNLDTEFCYIPILMPNDMLDRYPARSSYSRKEDVIYCCPQLDYDRYKSGDGAVRREVVYEGLGEARKLMKRANFSDAQIEEFLAIVEAAKSEAISSAPKRRFSSGLRDILRTLSR